MMLLLQPLHFSTSSKPTYFYKGITGGVVPVPSISVFARTHFGGWGILLLNPVIQSSKVGVPNFGRRVSCTWGKACWTCQANCLCNRSKMHYDTQLAIHIRLGPRWCGNRWSLHSFSFTYQMLNWDQGIDDEGLFYHGSQVLFVFGGGGVVIAFKHL